MSDDFLERALVTVVKFNNNRAPEYKMLEQPEMSRLMFALLVREGLMEVADAIKEVTRVHAASATREAPLSKRKKTKQ
jgi:hypothetical protein